MKIGAIILAAGSSERMNGKNKLLLDIGGHEVIAKTLTNFNNTETIDYIIAVTRPDMVETIEYIKKQYGIHKLVKIVVGGNTRQNSVKNGLEECPEDTDIIAIHDGARPFAEPELIKQTIDDCKKYGAAMPGVKVKETIKEVKDGFISRTPERDKLYIAQTPQVFKFKDYKDAFAKADEENLDFTDDCQIIEHAGQKVYITKGNYRNIKITTVEDIEIAKFFTNQESKECDK